MTHITLEEALLINSVTGMGLHLIAGSKWVYGHAQKERRVIIRRHVQHKHASRLKDCLTGECSNLRTVTQQSYR